MDSFDDLISILLPREQNDTAGKGYGGLVSEQRTLRKHARALTIQGS